MSICGICNGTLTSDRLDQKIKCQISDCLVTVHRKCSGLNIDRPEYVRMLKAVPAEIL
jgi:hypothetical protein